MSAEDILRCRRFGTGVYRLVDGTGKVVAVLINERNYVWRAQAVTNTGRPTGFGVIRTTKELALRAYAESLGYELPRRGGQR